MRKIRRSARTLNRDAALLQDADAALVEFVDQRPVVGGRVLPLLLRPDDEHIWLARKHAEPFGQILEATSGNRVDIVGREVAVAREDGEDRDVVR